MKGTIKTLLKDKAIGFIAVEGQSDVFFHKDGLVGVSYDDLNPGDALTFETEEQMRNGEKKMKAVNVQRA